MENEEQVNFLGNLFIYLDSNSLFEINRNLLRKFLNNGSAII